MSPKVKLALGVAAAAAVVGVVLYRRRGSRGGKVTMSEYSIADCKCWRTERYEDGRTQSTRVSRLRCVFDGLDFGGCPDASLDDITGTFPSETRIDVE